MTLYIFLPILALLNFFLSISHSTRISEIRKDSDTEK